MSSTDVDSHGTLSTPSVNTDPLVPKDPDGEPIIWDGNDAHIAGTMFDTQRYYRRTGLFQPLIQHRGVQLNNGKLAVESYLSVSSAAGLHNDPRTLSDPCPPTATRKAEYETRTGATVAAVTAMPAGMGDSFVLSKFAVEQEDGKLLRSLTNVFGHAESSDDLLDGADGSGYNLIVALNDKSTRADPKDKAVAAAKYASAIRNGVIGELGFDSLKVFEKHYGRVHRNMAATARQGPEAEVEMINLIAYKDPAIAEISERTSLSAFSDASWETAHSTSGWAVLWQSAVLTWASRKQKSIALSSCEAEIIALSEAAKDVVYLRKLVKGLDAEEPTPTSLATDSKSARDVSYNPEHHDRMKHVQRRHFFVRDMVESLEIEVPFVRTDDNPADFFTKPYPNNAKKFHAFRRILMNERGDLADSASR